jgi:hypothetical protein
MTSSESESSTPLIQISSLTRNNSVFTSVICNPLHLISRYTINRVLSRLCFNRALTETFPTATKTFLYYFTSPERPRIAGELRIRVASSDDSASFESGYDLLELDDQPWSRPLYVLSKYYIPLYEKLREDGFVPDDLNAVLSTNPQRPPIYRHLRRCLYTLNDTFIVDFSDYSKWVLYVITEQGTTTLRSTGLFSDFRLTLETPYTGAHTNHHLLDL